MSKNQTRRNFLRAAPVAAALSFTHPETLLAANGSAEQAAAPTEPFQVFTEQKLTDALKLFHTQPGEHYLYQPKTLPITIAMTTQGKTAGKMFEYHEGRDHIFLILEGAATFELGGTPKEPKNTRPGEWLAAMSEGATTVEVNKGDLLLVPRGTPHKQSTAESVAWMLISTSGAK